MRVFVTGASGHLGSAIVPELIAAGHDVVGLARSDAAAATITAYGASVHRGDLADLDGLAKAAADADGVIHLAFDHERMRTGDWAAAIAADLDVLHAFGDTLAGTGKALVGTSGTLAVANLGRPGTEEDAGNPGGRTDAENAVIGFAERGVRSSVVRVPPVTHSTLDRHGFARTLIAIARQTGVAGYPGDGTNRWAAGHTLDVAHLYRLALEGAPAGTRWHAAGDEGIPVREIAQSIGDHLGLPAESIPADRLQQHFGFLAAVIVLDNPTSTAVTRRVLGWQPAHPGLLADFDHGDYFRRLRPRANSERREPLPPRRPRGRPQVQRHVFRSRSVPGLVRPRDALRHHPPNPRRQRRVHQMARPRDSHLGVGPEVPALQIGELVHHHVRRGQRHRPPHPVRVEHVAPHGLSPEAPQPVGVGVPPHEPGHRVPPVNQQRRQTPPDNPRRPRQEDPHHSLS